MYLIYLNFRMLELNESLFDEIEEIVSEAEMQPGTGTVTGVTRDSLQTPSLEQDADFLTLGGRDFNINDFLFEQAEPNLSQILGQVPYVESSIINLSDTFTNEDTNNNATKSMQLDEVLTLISGDKDLDSEWSGESMLSDESHSNQQFQSVVAPENEQKPVVLTTFEIPNKKKLVQFSPNNGYYHIVAGEHSKLELRVNFQGIPVEYLNDYTNLYISLVLRRTNETYKLFPIDKGKTYFKNLYF